MTTNTDIIDNARSAARSEIQEIMRLIELRLRNISTNIVECIAAMTREDPQLIKADPYDRLEYGRVSICLYSAVNRLFSVKIDAEEPAEIEAALQDALHMLQRTINAVLRDHARAEAYAAQYQAVIDAHKARMSAAHNEPTRDV